MKMSIKINPDHEGYTGRECPKCEKYFKIKFGTGLPNATDCHCPYCNYTGPQDEFWTKQQIKYAQSVALNKISVDLLKSLKKLEIKPNRNQLFSIGISVKGNTTPITYYLEKDLEEKITCNNCTLEYSIYGTFGYCPDCGIHNSLQIFFANLDLIQKILTLAPKENEEIRNKLIENSLEDLVSTFDGFGRETCSTFNKNISFQNISAAREKIKNEKQFDISLGLSDDQWKFIEEQFQKRHLLAHRMGIIDEEYINKTGKPPSMKGRKVSISSDDVNNLINYLKIISNNLYKGIM